MNWISVNDRLPEEDEEVLIWGNGMWVACILAFEHGKPIFIEPYSSHTIENVTHWMPLPEPPKM